MRALRILVVPPQRQRPMGQGGSQDLSQMQKRALEPSQEDLCL